jgi:hypothetical protein
LKSKRSADAGNVQHRFSLSGNHPIVASFGEHQQSKLGGAPLLLRLEQHLQLVFGAAAAMRDMRLQWQIRHSFYQLLWQRVLLICCGYEDGLDSKLLAHDPGLRLSLIGAEAWDSLTVASQATIARFENSMTGANCYRFAAWLVFAYILNKKEAPKEIRLDFDGSCFPAYGKQQGTSYRKYYETNMFFPLFVFDQDGVLITAILRPGHHVECNQTLPVLKRLVKSFRAAWPKVRLTVVMDAAFNDQRIFDWCEDQVEPVYYLIKLRNNGGDGSGLTSCSKGLSKLARESFGRRFGHAKYLPVRKGGKRRSPKTKTEVEKEIRQQADKRKRKVAWIEYHARHSLRYGEFFHRTGKGGKDKKAWRQDRRVLVQCVYDDWGARNSFWVTNIPDGDPATLITETYSRRANAELRIKDAKELRCDKMSCASFMANQFRLLMHVLAQRLMTEFRQILPAIQRAKSLNFIQENFLCIPAIIGRKRHHTELLWSASHPLKNQMHAVCGRLESLQRANLYHRSRLRRRAA